MSLRYLLGTARRRLRGMLRRRPWEGAGALRGLKLELPRGFEYYVAYEEYEPVVAAALQRLVRPGFVCADVGANVGVLTLLLGRLVGPEGRVIAFEANAENAELLRRNVKRNVEIEARVVVEEAAVTDGSADSIELFPARGGGHGEWTISHEFAAREDLVAIERPSIRVRAISLDGYFPSGSRLDLVKMDIEGAEPQAVAGMWRLLAEARPVLVLEFHREVGWPAIPALLEAGYSLESLDGTALQVPAGPDDVPYQLVARPG